MFRDLPEDEDEPERFDERYEGEFAEQDVWRSDREIVGDEIAVLDRLLAVSVKRDRKLDELLRLLERVEQESPRGNEEKVLVFTEYRETQRYLVRELERKYGQGAVVVIHGDMKLERQSETEQDLERVWQPFAQGGALEAPTTKSGTADGATTSADRVPDAHPAFGAARRALGRKSRRLGLGRRCRVSRP